MRALIAITMMLALFSVAGCWNSQSSDKGGIAPIDEEFSITVPGSSTIKQGEAATIVVTLNRGTHFKQNVQLKIKADGITATPTSMLIEAGDEPTVNIQITAGRDVAIGEYRVVVTGTPATGRPASTTCVVKVVSK